jgi:hypothetical protein
MGDDFCKEWIRCVANEEARPRADVIAVLPGMFAVSERFYKSSAYAQVIGDNGECARWVIDDEPIYAVNLLNIYNALDRSRSQIRLSESGQILGIDRYVFHAARLGEPWMFKIPQTANQEILLLLDYPHGVEEFMALLAESGFTGLIFDRLWDDAEYWETRASSSEIGGAS